MFRLFKILFGFSKPRTQTLKQKTAESVDIECHKQVPISVKLPARSAQEVLKNMHSLPNATVLQVIDGDSVIVATRNAKFEVRLDSIDCPEDGQDWGETARFGLVELIGGKTVRVEIHGTDFYGRTLATLYVLGFNPPQWINVNERMIILGHAWVMRKYYDHLPDDRKRQLDKLQNWARSRKVGLWNTLNPIPPWRWRRERDAVDT